MTYTLQAISGLGFPLRDSVDGYRSYRSVRACRVISHNFTAQALDPGACTAQVELPEMYTHQ